mmetsp:Transcript_1976/g.3217  ORF Transcript_1976/g.3217 Transcript_1976/m.3217 type:complete len:305 (-) Transcript_1976:466-1380(-)
MVVNVAHRRHQNDLRLLWQLLKALAANSKKLVKLNVDGTLANDGVVLVNEGPAQNKEVRVALSSRFNQRFQWLKGEVTHSCEWPRGYGYLPLLVVTAFSSRRHGLWNSSQDAQGSDAVPAWIQSLHRDDLAWKEAQRVELARVDSHTHAVRVRRRPFKQNGCFIDPPFDGLVAYPTDNDDGLVRNIIYRVGGYDAVFVFQNFHEPVLPLVHELVSALWRVKHKSRVCRRASQQLRDPEFLVHNLLVNFRFLLLGSRSFFFLPLTDHHGRELRAASRSLSKRALFVWFQLLQISRPLSLRFRKRL